VKATFFAGGKWLRSHEERARQLMADPLFEIGNHSEAHRNLRKLEGVRLVQEIAGPQRAYEAIRAGLAQSQCIKGETDAMSGVAPRLALFRFPYGACSEASLQAVRDQGLYAIQWDFSTGDPAPQQSATAIAHVLVTRARPGSIVLAHANGRGWHTAAALPLAIPKLRKMGFEFVTVSELLAAGEPVASPTCYDSRPGDTDRYDNLLAHHPLAAQPHAAHPK
jgi:peptidoglycan/xylan/chitin deacetylase (PgdA/CDA1 family)